MLINNPQNSPHQQHPKKTQQQTQIAKTLNHQRTFLSKTIYIRLKKDTHDNPNH